MRDLVTPDEKYRNHMRSMQTMALNDLSELHRALCLEPSEPAIADMKRYLNKLKGRIDHMGRCVAVGGIHGAQPTKAEIDAAVDAQAQP